MISKIKFILGSLVALLPSLCQAQLVQSAGTLLRGKSALEFYEMAISNPSQIILLSVEIRSLFASSSTRYRDLNNELAQKMKWFDVGPLSLEQIELKSEPSQSHQYGNYSITLKKLNLKQCDFLSKNKALNEHYVRVEVNGNPVFLNGVPQQSVVLCKPQRPLHDGGNEVKYIGY